MGSKQILNSGNNSKQIAAKIVQATLNNLFTTLFTEQVEELEYISNGVHAKQNSKNNKSLHRKKKEQDEVKQIKQGILKGTLPYMVVDSRAMSSC